MPPVGGCFFKPLQAVFVGIRENLIIISIVIRLLIMGKVIDLSSLSLSCSIIGSFRRYYDEVTNVISIFGEAGIKVNSPASSCITNPEDLFVRFKTDSDKESNVEIELKALINITKSDFIYVVNPGGYMGTTVSYEVGRIHERHIPIFFMNNPFDFPVYIPDSAVISPVKLVKKISSLKRLPVATNNGVPERTKDLLELLEKGVR